jgi:hypothetical protein
MATAVAPFQRQSNQSRAEFQSRLTAFDPREFMRESAGSALSSLMEQFNANEGMRTVGLNRRGLMGSNLGAGGAMRDLNSRVANTLGSLSMQAGQMEMERIGGFGSIAAQDLERFTSERQLEEDRENARRQERTSRRGSLLGLVGTIGGSVLGGPIGGAIGNAIGRRFGGG